MITRFKHYCQQVLPAVYDDSLSYYESICKMVKKLNEVIDAYDVNGQAISELRESINRLEAELDKFKESGFNDYYKEQVKLWIDEHLQWVFENFVKQVFFGLTDDGYFCAYVPSSWDDITFDTGMVYGQDDYGRLKFLFEAVPATV